MPKIINTEDLERIALRIKIERTALSNKAKERLVGATAYPTVAGKRTGKAFKITKAYVSPVGGHITLEGVSLNAKNGVPGTREVHIGASSLCEIEK